MAAGKRNLVVPSSSIVIFLLLLRRCSSYSTEMGFWSDLVSSSVTAMYVLGDSSVDCGDNTPFYSLSHRNYSLFPCNGSDSTLIPHILAGKMGLTRISPFYSQNSSIRTILGGVNFGSAEATILYPRGRNFQSLNQQLRQAFDTVQLIQLHLGEQFTKDFIQSSVFYLSFGKDDIADYFLSGTHGLGSGVDNRNFSRILAHQMENAVRNLYAVDVRKMVVAGVLPLGCAPRMTMMMMSKNDGRSSSSRVCSDEVNSLVVEYNAWLEKGIMEINAELPDVHIVYFDVYRAMLEYIKHPNAYGFEDARKACCGNIDLSGCVAREMACENSLTYVWWDLYNPTPLVNSLLAKSAFYGEPMSNICRPMNVQTLLSAARILG